MKNKTIRADGFNLAAYTKRDPDLGKEIEKITDHYGISKAQLIRELVYQFGYKIDTTVLENRILRQHIKHNSHIQMLIERGLLKAA